MLRLEKEHQDKAQDVDQGKDDHKDSLINFTNDNNLAIGMIVHTSDEAYAHCNHYANRLGFEIQRRGLRTKDDKLFKFVITCNKEDNLKLNTDLTSSRKKIY